MQGLILKDILNIKGYMKTVLLVLFIFVAYGIALKNGLFVGLMITILLCQQVMTTMSYDDLAKWDKFALTMNVDRSDIVKSKFVFFIGTLIVSYISGIVVSIIINQTVDVPLRMIEVILPFSIIIAVYTIIFSIIMPLLFKNGVEKTRIIMMILYFIPVIIVFLGLKLIPDMELNILTIESIIEGNSILILIGMLILMAISILFSYKASLSIYLKKEF